MSLRPALNGYWPSGAWKCRPSTRYVGGGETIPCFVVEAEVPCINGLSAWFEIVNVVEFDEYAVGMSAGGCGEAEEIAKLFSLAPRLYAYVATKAAEGDMEARTLLAGDTTGEGRDE